MNRTDKVAPLRASNWLVAGLSSALALLLLTPACRAEMVQAKGFSEAKMRGLPIGSSQEEVLGVLGEPLERWNHWNNSGAWDATYWSYRKKTTSYGLTHHAVLIFSPDGRLRVRQLEWYED